MSTVLALLPLRPTGPSQKMPERRGVGGGSSVPGRRAGSSPASLGWAGFCGSQAQGLVGCEGGDAHQHGGLTYQKGRDGIRGHERRPDRAGLYP